MFSRQILSESFTVHTASRQIKSTRLIFFSFFFFLHLVREWTDDLRSPKETTLTFLDARFPLYSSTLFEFNNPLTIAYPRFIELVTLRMFISPRMNDSSESYRRTFVATYDVTRVCNWLQHIFVSNRGNL